MQITDIKREKLNFECVITVPAFSIDASYVAMLNNVMKDVSIPGFRKGKAPKSFVESQFGDSVMKDVLKEQLSSIVQTVTTQNGLRTVQQPDVTVQAFGKGEDLVVQFACEVYPDITLPDLSAFTIEKPKVTLSEQELKDEVMRVVADFSEVYEDSNSSSADGDMIVINFSGSVNGEKFDGGTASDYNLKLGSKSFIDTFEEQLIGKSVGDKVLVKVTFPTSYHQATLAGKDAEFDVEVLKVKKCNITDVTDDIAKQIGYGSAEEYKNKIAQDMQAEADNLAYFVARMRLFNLLDEAVSCDVPESLMKNERAVVKNEADRIMNLDGEKSPEEIEAFLNKMSERRLKIGFIVSQYAKMHNVIVSNNDIARFLSARMGNVNSDVLVSFLQKNPKIVESIYSDILQDKVVQHMLDHGVVITEVDMSSNDINEIVSATENQMFVS